MIFDLPTTLTVCGVEYEIRTDFRDILNILLAFDDPDLSNSEKALVCLYILYVDFEDIPQDAYKQAFDAALEFIDNGMEGKPNSPRTMDWEQDAPILFPAVNNAAGYETRSAKYIHWWTFLGYFMEIKDGTFSTVLSLRLKRAKNKKMEQWEKDFWKENVRICQLHTKLTEEEKAEKERLNALLG